LLAAHLNVAPTVPLFFHTFGLQRSCPKGEKAKGKAPKGQKQEPAKHGWVSLKQRKSLFKIFEESIRGFKDKFYGVRPCTGEAWKTIVTRGPRKDASGNVVMGPDGVPFEDDFAFFHFYWNEEHYEIP
ncbi:hypothetical protein A2U01_0055059, partial [Trifolium medium]|nr:hypothetical protein [Trifolium medium]